MNSAYKKKYPPLQNLFKNLETFLDWIMLRISNFRSQMINDMTFFILIRDLLNQCNVCWFIFRRTILYIITDLDIRLKNSQGMLL